MIPEVDGGPGEVLLGQQHCCHLVVESPVVVEVANKVDINRYIHVSEPDRNQLRTNTQSSPFTVDKMTISYWLKQTQTCKIEDYGKGQSDKTSLCHVYYQTKLTKSTFCLKTLLDQ